MVLFPGRGALAVVFLIAAVAPARAQEDIEPRTIGAPGQTAVGMSGFVDRFASSEDTFPMQITLHVEVIRFVTAKLAARGGLVGSTSVGDDDDAPTGPGATSLDALGSVLYYFTPQSMVSLYAGGEYRAPLTQRAEKDAGTALGLFGVQAAVSSRASVFVQGGYGARLTRGDDGELQTRVVGEIGFRLRF